MSEKFKVLLRDDALFYSVLLVLVGLTAFGLGRHSVVPNAVSTSKTPAVQYYPAAVAVPVLNDKDSNQTTATLTASAAAPVAIAATDSNTTVVASKNGTKYHLPTCPGAKQIKEANVITFASPELAQAAGFEPAKNCQF